jgi:beta-lactamase class A
MMNKKFYFRLGTTLVILVVGFIFGKMERIKSTGAVQSEQINHEREGDFNKKWSFINPLLDCGEISSVSNQNIINIREKTFDLIEAEKIQKNLTDVAVYFRDLNNGPWFGVNEKDGFLPASLLKVPLMISVFKQAMDDPAFLGKQFVYQGESKNKEYFKAGNELKNNQAYSVNEAVAYMIRYSDNNASHVLSYALDTSTITTSYSELGILLPDRLDYSISARTYGSFFRILYNSTFLNKEYSEQALRLLSETEFDKGLVAGVPKSIKVAHKFGERQVVGITKQLHDCGIIYYPNHPYLLCVMTRGQDFDKLSSFIAQISKIVYNAVDKERGGYKE